MASSVTVRLGLIATSMRAGGARVGLGKGLNAHRVLRAVDPADPRAARDALRAALCARREDLPLFDAAFAELMAPCTQAAGAELLEELGPAALRPGRRLRPSRRRGSQPDLRRRVRHSLRHHGEPFERHWRSPEEHPRPAKPIRGFSLFLSVLRARVRRLSGRRE